MGWADSNSNENGHCQRYDGCTVLRKAEVREPSSCMYFGVVES